MDSGSLWIIKRKVGGKIENSDIFSQALLSFPKHSFQEDST